MGHLLHQQMEIINSEENQGLFVSYIKKIFKLKFTDDNEVCVLHQAALNKICNMSRFSEI
jgi:hypothetical protein